jgi:hypothetical protein
LGDCFRPSVSDDGGRIVFETTANMAAPGEFDRDNPGLGLEDRDIYVRDLTATPDVTRLLSVTPTGQVGNSASFFASVAGDGDWAAFTSASMNFGGGFTPSGQTNVYRAATSGAGVEIVSVAPDAQGNDVLPSSNMQTGQLGLGGDGSVGHVLTPAGDVISFYGATSTWAGGLSSTFQQVYVRDLRDVANKHTFLVSPPGPNESSRSSSISLIGASTTQLAAAYSTFDTTQDPGGPAGVEDVFLAEMGLEDGVIDLRRKVSIAALHGNAASIVPVVSRGADFVAFASLATNLVPGDTNMDRDVFLWRRATQTMRRWSVTTNGSQVNGTGVESTAPDVTEDGLAVVFESTQSALVTGDTNGFRDVFRRFNPSADFRRGDADNTGVVNLNDAVFINNFLFLGGPPPGCRDAADADDNGVLELTDSIRVLNYLFSGGPPPPAPGPTTCGTDPTVDLLPCDSQTSCPQ